MGQSITAAGEMELAVPRDEKKRGSWGAGREKTQNRGRSRSMCSVGSAWRAGDAESSEAEVAQETWEICSDPVQVSNEDALVCEP